MINADKSKCICVQIFFKIELALHFRQNPLTVRLITEHLRKYKFSMKCIGKIYIYALRNVTVYLHVCLLLQMPKVSICMQNR